MADSIKAWLKARIRMLLREVACIMVVDVACIVIRR
jgi:hypothetical protein